MLQFFSNGEKLFPNTDVAFEMTAENDLRAIKRFFPKPVITLEWRWLAVFCGKPTFVLRTPKRTYYVLINLTLLFFTSTYYLGVRFGNQVSTKSQKKSRFASGVGKACFFREIHPSRRLCFRGSSECFLLGLENIPFWQNDLI